MSSDPRNQQPFEYMLQSNSIFPDVNFITQNISRPLFQASSGQQQQNEYSTNQVIATTYAATNSSTPLFTQNLNTQEDFSNTTGNGNVQIVDTDDIDFAPNADGELTSGCRKCGIDYGSSTELKLHFGAVHCRQTFECCVCNKLFIRRHGFLVHIKR